MESAWSGPDVPVARVVHLATPALRCVVPDRTFDAFGWCASDELEWRRPADRWETNGRLDGSDPARMVFVLREPCEFLPRELARLHAFRLGLTDEWALAPWGIDAATDELHAHGVQPGKLLWLAADNLNALFWGLHDWVHFHNHGPFEDRAWTELQCDTGALAWLWINRHRVELAGATWERLRCDVVALAAARFAAERIAFDERWLAAARVLEVLPPGPG